MSRELLLRAHHHGVADRISQRGSPLLQAASSARGPRAQRDADEPSDRPHGLEVPAPIRAPAGAAYTRARTRRTRWNRWRRTRNARTGRGTLEGLRARAPPAAGGAREDGAVDRRLRGSGRGRLRGPRRRRQRQARSSGSPSTRTLASPVTSHSKPSDRARSQWYFQRYVEPRGGRGRAVRRSWYNRAGIEHVLGFCTSEEYERFLRQAPIFERLLSRTGSSC